MDDALRLERCHSGCHPRAGAYPHLWTTQEAAPRTWPVATVPRVPAQLLAREHSWERAWTEWLAGRVA